MGTANWVFPEAGSYQVHGRDLSEDNFAHEERTGLELLMREILQNPLDARAPGNDGPIRVKFRVLKPGEYDAGYLAQVFPVDYQERLAAAGGDKLPPFESTTILVLEDYGTTGLLGSWDDPNVDGRNENWNAFWFREGEGAKSTPGSNGRAGQGKITYYKIGGARAVFGLTVRASDGKTLLMGRSAFKRVYPFDGKKYLRHSFWCGGGDLPLPLTDEDSTAKFTQAFKLERRNEAGLSLVIPFPNDFQPKVAMRTVISEFYFPITAGKLALSIGGMEVDASKIDSLADILLPDDFARERKSSFTKEFRRFANQIVAEEKSGATPLQLKSGWDKSPTIDASYFPEGALEELRDKIEKGQRITVRFPVAVRPKSSAAVESYFDVHLQIPEELDRTEEAYVRRDLLIGLETHLGSSGHLQKARAATMIRESELSAFLADAEEPTHLKWNASRPRLAEDYVNPQATLRAVRKAAPRLLAAVSNGLVSRDLKALAKYFTNTADVGKPAAGKKQKGEKSVGDQTPPPPPVRKPLRSEFGVSSVSVVPNGTAMLQVGELPIVCTLEAAYEGLDQNPFDAYDPFDFDLADENTHQIAVVGATARSRKDNRFEFEVTHPEFSVSVSGFDPNIRLRARVLYKEAADGSAISEE